MACFWEQAGSGALLQLLVQRDSVPCLTGSLLLAIAWCSISESVHARRAGRTLVFSHFGDVHQILHRHAPRPTSQICSRFRYAHRHLHVSHELVVLMGAEQRGTPRRLSERQGSTQSCWSHFLNCPHNYARHYLQTMSDTCPEADANPCVRVHFMVLRG